MMAKLFWRWTCLLLLLCCAAVAFWQFDHQLIFVAQLTDALHTPAAALLLLTLNLWLGRYITPHWRLLIAVVALIAIELLQPLTGRAAEWHDLFNGLLGLLIVLLWPNLRWPLSMSLLVLAFALGARSLIGAFFVQYQMQAALPDLMVKPRLESRYGWHAIAQSPVQQQQLASARFQLQVALSDAQWQGVVWHNPALDLSDIAELCFSAKANTALALKIRIDDVLSQDYQTRFNTQVQLQPRWQRFCLDLTHLTDGQQRVMDKTRLLHWYFFAKAPATTARFSLAQVQLYFQHDVAQ